MSDEEFVRECGPGTNPQIALRVRRIVADQLGVDYERVHPSSSFANDLMAD
jgi:acyl carrier protein